MSSWEILVGDCRAELEAIPDRTVQCVVTSPPYFGLRDYGTAEWVGGDPDCDHQPPWTGQGKHTNGGQSGNVSAADRLNRKECRCGARRIDQQIGIEDSVADYVENLVAVFREVWRVLRDDGVVWLNLGDSYASRSQRVYAQPETYTHNHREHKNWERVVDFGAGHKNLLGIPWRVAFALQADGWTLRSEVIWSKPNPMPESVSDRPTRAHEHVFLLARSERYFYDGDAIREEQRVENNGSTWSRDYHAAKEAGGLRPGTYRRDYEAPPDGKRNARSVWEITTKPFKGAHFAVFPPDLAERCILAGSSPYACPNCGAPWVRAEGEVRAGHTRGWRPTCACGAPEGTEPDDLEPIASPLGSGGEDPTLERGRRGLARPRSDDGGQRILTRYEQRRYARQLRSLSSGRRLELANEVGADALAHYARTDRAGARAIPQDVLKRWIAQGYLTPVEQPPMWEPPEPIGSLVLDPFCGSGTVGVVCLRHGRRFLGIDLSSEYAELARRRIVDDQPLLNGAHL